MNWRKTQLCKISVLMHPGLGTRQKWRICTKSHNPLFESVFCTWGSTAGPCPANLCKELTWGTLMGTAVIVPKVCWKKNIWTQLKTIVKLSQTESLCASRSLPALFLFPAALAEGSLGTRLFSKKDLKCTTVMCIGTMRHFMVARVTKRYLLCLRK